MVTDYITLVQDECQRDRVCMGGVGGLHSQLAVLTDAMSKVAAVP
jgi:hypothetical protein